MSGLHYAVDVLGAIPVFGFSLAAYRWWGEPLYRSAAKATRSLAPDGTDAGTVKAGG
jgi:hypothetical protein